MNVYSQTLKRHDSSKTKILATIGPASSNYEILKSLFLAGIDVCRLNFSHGNHESHKQVIDLIRQLNEELKSNVAILADLQGPKLRVGEIKNGVIELKNKAQITFTTHPCVGDENMVYINYEPLANDVKIGETILIDDGKIQLKVVDTDQSNIVTAEIIHGGTLKSRKGVNLPYTKISMPSLTEKDIGDANFALKNNVDWIALSFVRKAVDITNLKKLIEEKRSDAKVIAKIEKPEAVKNMDDIIECADGIMVARGDLGVELSFEKVPVIQKEIVGKCISKSKPVIIATQMLESMINNFRPTRAEANDVASAVFDCADAVMLSGETSVGKYPVEAIRAMQSVIDFSEGKEYVYKHEHLPLQESVDFLPDSICYNACKIADFSSAKAIITFTHSGNTALKIASQRPDANIFAFSSNKKIINKLSLVWGVWAFYIKDVDDINDAIVQSKMILKEMKHLKNNDVVVHVGSIPMKNHGKTNMIKIGVVE